MNKFTHSHGKTAFCLLNDIVSNTLFITVKISQTLALKNQFLNFMVFSNRDGDFASMIAEAPGCVVAQIRDLFPLLKQA